MGREFGPDGLELFLEKKSINLPAGFTPSLRPESRELSGRSCRPQPVRDWSSSPGPQWSRP